MGGTGADLTDEGSTRDAGTHSVDTPSYGAAKSSSKAETPSLLVDVPSTSLYASHIGNFYPFNQQLVPEAFQEFHQAFYAPRPGHLQRKGGCKGLQAEFSTSGSSHLMLRRCTHELVHAVSLGVGQRVLLQGPSGSGKSVALVQLVEWARASGWIVVYVPSAAVLTSGGFFYKRSDGSGLYDTIISAQHILKSVADAHRDQLAALPRQVFSASLQQGDDDAAVGPGAATVAAATPGNGSLLDLVLAGMRSDNDGQAAVEAVQQLLQGLVAVSHTQPVLIAVDDYNVLHWRTGYGATTYVGGFSGRNASKRQYMHRRELRVEELALAGSMRVLAPPQQRSPGGTGVGSLGHARVVCAVTAGAGVPQTVPLALTEDVQEFHMPRYSFVEAAHALCFYHERGLLGDVPTEQQVVNLRSITNGHAGELRRLALQASMVDLQAYG